MYIYTETASRRPLHPWRKTDRHREIGTVRLELFISNLIETWILEELRLELGKNKSKGDQIWRFMSNWEVQIDKKLIKVGFWDQNGSPRRPSCTQGPQVEGKRCPKSPKSSPETPQDPKSVTKRAQIGPEVIQNCQKSSKKHKPNLERFWKRYLEWKSLIWEDFSSLNLQKT